MTAKSREKVTGSLALAAEIAADVLLVGVAYILAFFLRFDFNEPPWGWRAVAASYGVVSAVHVAFFWLSGCYRVPWRRAGVREIPRAVAACAAACAALVAMRFLLSDVAMSHLRPPYSVTIICFVLSSFAVASARLVVSAAMPPRPYWEDLITRSERHFDTSAAARFFAGKVVMVTGAGGSIGSEIVRQTASSGAKKLLLVERGENALYEIDREMRQKSVVAEIKPLMIDVNDAAKMEAVFAAEKPDVVLHAAAYKHVPMVEMNPDEGWRNNTEATRSIAEIALRHGVGRFVLISTDKAVNPVSVMGRTKKAAEEAVMALNGKGGTSFCAVRFGNVLGSSGSVVSLFREQISKKMPVTVTHPEMRRYFMTIQEAVGLVLQAATRSEGAIYTLDMGESVKILDLAEEMIARAGYRPYDDIPIVFTGIRPGEKLVEELGISEDSACRTDMAKIYITKS